MASKSLVLEVRVSHEDLKICNMIEKALLDLNTRAEVFSVYVYPPLGRSTRKRPFYRLSKVGVLVEKEMTWQEEVFHSSLSLRFTLLTAFILSIV